MCSKVELQIGGRTFSFESGKMAKQAHGAVYAVYGETSVLGTVVQAEARPGLDFFPLTVDYREKTSAAGRYPGGFFKREGRPTEKEILTMRCIDRPVRPLFPDGFLREVQIMTSVFSADEATDPDVVAMNAAFAALEISDIPFHGPVAAVRIGRIDGEFIVNPTYQEKEETTLNLLVAGTDEAILMVEGGANEEPEKVVLDALSLAHDEIRKIIQVMKQLREQCGRDKTEFVPPELPADLKAKVRDYAEARLNQALRKLEKKEREEAVKAVYEEMAETLVLPEGSEENADEYSKNRKTIFLDLEKELVRRMISRENLRADGRRPDVVRDIRIEVGLLPRTHGSSLFTRGQTQSLATVTLGTVSDEQIVDSLIGEESKRFMLHYNFPPFSVGEARALRGPGRREIGHGALAERALTPMLPTKDEFPYTIRIVSDILESNGSSSMATVCSGCLALMDAGVPIKAPVAGVAMGLVLEEGKATVLTDILGLEDHLGDMDFKVTGTRIGITAFQMDVKVQGISPEIMTEALEQARKARVHILDRMQETLAEPREDLRPFAPRISIMHVPVEKIGDVIGPGGKIIRNIIKETGAKIDIEDDGTVVIATSEKDAADKARQMIEYLVADVEIGRTYNGKVVRVENFGAFVEVLPGKEGLVHISELSTHRVGRVEDICREGDPLRVKCYEIDDRNRINLSRRLVLEDEGVREDPLNPYGESRGGGRDDRGDRGGDRGDDRRDRGNRGGGGGGGGRRSGGSGDRRR